MNRGDITSLGAIFFWTVEQFQFDRLLTWKRGETTSHWSTAEFESAVLTLSEWLGSQCAKGDRVALYSENRPEWHIVDLAAHLAGLIVVPVYPTLAPHQMRQILQHADASVVFCGPEQFECLQGELPDLPGVTHAVNLDRDKTTENLPSILASTPPMSSERRAAVRERALAQDPEATATIVYTSGTTGTPKGVMLCHRNIVFNVLSAIRNLPERDVRQALSVLPLSHVLERVLSYSYFVRGVPIAYGDPHELRNLLPLYRPVVVGVVPRVLEKMRDAIEAGIAAMPAHRRQIARFLLAVGHDRLDGKKSVRAALYPVADLLMFRKIHRQFGDVEVFVCGGAWLNPVLERYFRAIGFVILQGYGLTETSPVISCNEYGKERVGTVGRPLGGVEVKVDESGEILTRGPQVMKGYYKDPDATASVFRDGWFVTGDLGRLEDDGSLVITGRRKEMLVLSNGKNIYYAPIEQAIRQSRLIEQAFLVGEGRNYTALIVVPNMAKVRQHALEEGLSPADDDALLMLTPIVALFRKTMDSQQAEFSRFEQAKRFCFLKEEALLDLELVTPTLKVRRAVLEKKYAVSIDQLYRQESPFVIPAVPASVPLTPVC